jgi:F-type H+-transporting ATPase subunit delta
VQINQIAREYARAIMQFAPDKYSQVITFFEKIAGCIKQSKTFSNLLNHPVISSDEKFKAVISLSDFPLPQVIEKVILDLVSRRGVDLVSLIIREMDSIYKKQHNIKDATVFSAAPLNEQEKLSITASIEKSCGAKAYVSYSIDKNLLAGYKVKIGDTVLDNTVRRQLQLVGDLLSFTNRV